jgi:hypothetical protein
MHTRPLRETQPQGLADPSEDALLDVNSIVVAFAGLTNLASWNFNMPFWARRLTLQGIIMDIMNLTTCESHYLQPLLETGSFDLYSAKSCHVDTKTSPLLRQASECPDSNSGMLFESPSQLRAQTQIPFPRYPDVGNCQLGQTNRPDPLRWYRSTFTTSKANRDLPDRSFPA